MVVREEWRARGRVGVQRLASGQAERLVRRLRPGAFVTWPSEIRHRPTRNIEAIEFLRLIPADVADPELGRARTDREPERIAKTVTDDAARVQVRRGEQRVVWQRGTGI